MLLWRRHSPEHGIAVRKTAEAADNIGMKLRPFNELGVASSLEKSEAIFLICIILGVFERQIEKCTRRHGGALVEALGESGKVFIENTNPGVSSVDDRAIGFQEVIAEYPNMEFVGMEYCDDDANIAAQQVSAVLQREPELAGIFGVNVFSAQGAGNAVKAAGLEGAVQIVSYDATIDAIENLRNGIVTMVLAQKPYDMGYMAVEFALADWRGVTSLPKRVTTGFAIITLDNVDDPEYSRFIYSVP